MKIKSVILLMAAALCLALTSCGSGGNAPASYKDGVFTGRSADHDEDESGNGSGYGEAEVELRDGSIASCTFKTYELDGTLKDESYGSDLSKENRLKAQKAVQAADKYAEMLLSSGSLEGVDAISGATISYNEFVEAVNDALDQASE